jgi:hypothetical protein
MNLRKISYLVWRWIKLVQDLVQKVFFDISDVGVWSYVTTNLVCVVFYTFPENMTGNICKYNYRFSPMST